MYRKVLTLLFVCSSLWGHSQTNAFGGSFTIGAKSPSQEFGMSLNYLAGTHVLFSLGYNMAKFNGAGFDCGANWVSAKGRIRPYGGLHYSRNGGAVFTIEHDNSYTDFKLFPVEFFYLKTGALLQIPEKKLRFPRSHGFFNFCVCYRYTSYSDVTAHVIGGQSPYKDQEGLNRRIGNGIGVCFGIVFLFEGKHNEKDTELKAK